MILPGESKPISQATRDSIRKAAADYAAARERASNVTRPDGTDGGGHPGIEAANLEGYLGRFAVPLLDALEDAQLALVAIAATGDGSLLGDEGCDDELERLFERKLLATRRDYCDEYFTVLTDEGREFVRRALGVA